jgi:glycogen debranching enzyme
VNGDFELLRPLLHKIVQNYNFWDKMRLDDNGLYWQKDDFDGMEMSIGGYSDIAGYRATINSYQYGDAIAISKMAVLNRDKVLAKQFRDKAKSIRRVVEAKLWDANASFFKVLPRTKRNSTLVDVRELHGFTPWYFNLPSENKSVAWLQLNDSSGFRAPFGLTSAEQRHPRFELAYKDHECQWNGPSWPFATSITLTALANLLNNYKQSYVSRFDYLEQLRIYAQAQHLMLDSGEVVPWIDEVWTSSRHLLVLMLSCRIYTRTLVTGYLVHG